MLLDVKNVSVRFASGHGVQAVENVSLTVDKKEKVCIVGETGSGKSILLLAILHLLPENAIVTGEAFFEGEDLIQMKRRQLDKIRGARISYVPQGSGNGLNPLLTVGFQVAEPMIEHQKIGKKEAIAEAVKLMKRFHIGDEEEVAAQYPFTYSGGMKQRAMIAMGIIAGADMILADEPTKGLDEERIEMVVDAFHSLKDQAVLCVTHDLNFAREISDSISVMYARPQDDVAVTARTPAAWAPIQVDMEECSDSTVTYSVSTRPLATYWAKYWGISVEGVMGKAAITSGSICFMAKAMASLPERRSL